MSLKDLADLSFSLWKIAYQYEFDGKIDPGFSMEPMEFATKYTTPKLIASVQSETSGDGLIPAESPEKRRRVWQMGAFLHKCLNIDPAMSVEIAENLRYRNYRIAAEQLTATTSQYPELSPFIWYLQNFQQIEDYDLSDINLLPSDYEGQRFLTNDFLLVCTAVALKKPELYTPANLENLKSLARNLMAQLDKLRKLQPIPDFFRHLADGESPQLNAL